MSIIRNTLLSFKIRTLIRKATRNRRSMNYKDARKIGILFCMNNQEQFDTIRQFEKKIRKDGKDLLVLCFLPKKIENFDFHFDIFSSKDFSMVGSVQADNILRFMAQPFDILICLEKEPNLFIEYLMAACQADFRIGPYINEKEALFELMIQQPVGSELKELINQIYHYTNEL